MTSQMLKCSCDDNLVFSTLLFEYAGNCLAVSAVCFPPTCTKLAKHPGLDTPLALCCRQLLPKSDNMSMGGKPISIISPQMEEEDGTS